MVSTTTILLLVLNIGIPAGITWLIFPVINHARLSTLTSDQIVEYSSTKRETTAVDYELSVVIPAYKEEARLAKMLDSTIVFLQYWAEKSSKSYEVIVVDDCSSDSTFAVAKRYQDAHVDVAMRILQLKSNQGKGGAVKVGVNAARGNYILMADADDATEFSAFERLYTTLKTIEINDTSASTAGSLGLAVGSRAHMEKDSIAQRAFYRTVLMKGFHVLVMCFCTRNVRDTQCGFKLFTRAAAKTLFGNLHLFRWAFDIEIIYMAEKLKIPITEMSVSWREVEGSKLIQSKLDVITTSIVMARDIICVRIAYLLGFWKLPTQFVA